MQSQWTWLPNLLESQPDKKQATQLQKLISSLFSRIAFSATYLWVGSPGSRLWDGKSHARNALEINSTEREAKKAELVRGKLLRSDTISVETLVDHTWKTKLGWFFRIVLNLKKMGQFFFNLSQVKIRNNTRHPAWEHTFGSHGCHHLWQSPKEAES